LSLAATWNVRSLVPPACIDQVRYLGILDPAARDRPLVVPAPCAPHPGETCLTADEPSTETAHPHRL